MEKKLYAMPLIIETEKDIDKKLNVSDPYGNLSNELVAAYASIQTDKKNGEASGQNIKRIEGLAKNVLGYEKDEDPSKTSIHLKSEQPKNSLNISKRQVKKALHDIGKLPQDQRGKYGNLVTKIEHVFANALKGNRNANKITKQFQPNNIKPQKPQNADDSSVKPLKAQNGTQIHIINENIDKNKKIILKEKQINVLKEYFNQLQIPFEEFGDENGKENYDYYLDYLEEVGTYGELPPSNMSKINLYEELDNRIFSLFNFLSTLEIINFIKKNPQYYTGTKKEIKSLYGNKLLAKITDEGLKILAKQLFDTRTFINSLTFNEKGLIYVERVISVNFPLKERPSEKTFHYFKKAHKTFGTYWTWKKGGAEEFRKTDYFKEKQNCFIFKGFVDPKSINVDGTLRANNSYPNECELTLKRNEPIQINEIIWLEENKKLPLNQPIIVQT